MNRTYLPVSPLVAPTTVSRSRSSPGAFRAFRRARKNSNRLPSSCSATSLNANVGPCHSSSTDSPPSRVCSGVTAGWRKPAYERSTRSRSSGSAISSGEMYSESTATARSVKESVRQDVRQSAGEGGDRFGNVEPTIGGEACEDRLRAIALAITATTLFLSDVVRAPLRKIAGPLHHALKSISSLIVQICSVAIQCKVVRGFRRWRYEVWCVGSGRVERRNFVYR